MSIETMKQTLEDYLSCEMPAGTVIGDPKWWAGKIANVLAKQEGHSNFCQNCEALARELKAIKQEQGEPVAIHQYSFKELGKKAPWYDGNQDQTKWPRHTYNHRIVYTTPLAKQEHGSPEDMYVEMHKHLNCPHCGGSGHIDDAKQEQGEPVAWVSFEEHEPPIDSAFDDPEVKSVRSVLVTNNICSKDRMGRHSHVWLAAPMKNSKGEWVAYTDSSRKIEYLTHWLDPFTTPQQRKPLTDEQIDEIIKASPKMDTGYAGWVRDQRRAWARAIEAAHGIKE